MKKIAITFLSLLFFFLVFGCTEQKSIAQFSCPDLYMVELTELSDAGLWQISTINYSTSTEKLMFINPQENEDGSKTFYCDLGSKFIELGESASNYVPDKVYCGDPIRTIVLYKVDASGSTINSDKTSVQIVFNGKTKEYVSTRCGTYSTVNSP